MLFFRHALYQKLNAPKEKDRMRKRSEIWQNRCASNGQSILPDRVPVIFMLSEKSFWNRSMFRQRLANRGPYTFFGIFARQRVAPIARSENGLQKRVGNLS